MSRDIELLEPETREMCKKLVAACEAAGFPIVVVQTLRTWEEQAALYAKGRSRPGAIVTNAKPGYSAHNFGRAFDVAFRKGQKGVSWSGPWSKVAQVARGLGLAWGGDWKSFQDKPHFEYLGGLSLAQLRAQHQLFPNPTG